MGQSAITTIGKQKMVKARASIIALPKIVGMAFGSGGVNSSGNIIAPSVADNRLKNQLLRKAIDSTPTEVSATCYRYVP